MLIAAALAFLACLVWPSAGRIPRPSAGRIPWPSAGRIPWSRAGARWSPSAAEPGWSRRRGTRRPRTGRGRQPWVADFAEVVAVGLDAGLDLGSAALTAARSPGVGAGAPWLSQRLGESVAEGHGVASLLVDESTVTADERRDLGLLVAAWRLAEEAGAATAAVTEAAAASIRGRHAAAARTAVVVAGPRASMWLLSALPVAGPVAAVLVGIGPTRLYATGAARLLAAAGLLLTVAGWWWAGSLLRRAQRAGRTDGTVG